MNKTATKKGASANTTKPLVGFKTTGEDTEGTTDYCLVSFFVNGVLPAMGGYAATLSDDGYTIRWSRPVDAFLFSMEHLRSIMGRAYSDSNVRVRSYDDVTQAISRDKIEQDVNGLFWGKPQEIILKDKCTVEVIIKVTTLYPRKDIPTIRYKGMKHRQFNTIVEMKVKLAEQRKTATKKTKTEKPLEIFSSQEGSTPSPGARSRKRSKYRDWGGSHREMGHGSRVSNESKDYSSDESE